MSHAHLQIVIDDEAPGSWEDFEIGIAEIDLQHRRLNSLLQRLKNAIGNKFGFATSAILAELIVETRIHFAVEDSLMRLLAYAEIEEHVFEHRKLVEQLEEFEQRAQDFDVSSEMSNFIQTWLIDHINDHDRKLATHLISKGIDPKVAPKAG